MSSYPFVTLAGEGNSRIEIKNSVFIGRATRIGSREEAEGFVREARDMYPDARHTCYAWIFDGDMHMSKYSDDGEPSGTAGLPILSVLEKPGITNAAITVTRYFGGVLLGKGGLVKAYTDAAAECVRDAGKVSADLGLEFRLDTGYDMADKMIFTLRNSGFEVADTGYSDIVSIKTVTASSRADELIKLITDRSSGRVTPVKTGERELLSRLED
ncbi:MAG: YigZ family protein [Clostridiales bacterium]|nr:YigZ family protein [Clostridiales bacterium]